MRKGLFTTNDQKPMGQGEPKPLNHVTTAIIPEAPKDVPAPKGDGFAKMITTHDDDKVAVKVDEPIVLAETEPKKKARKAKQAK